jgi:ABC-type dipeptide/oligopeptide/nickel transport system permease component
VITEAIFAWPGLGTLAINAINSRDYPMVQGVVLLAAVVFVMLNLLVDLVYGLFDPRIRYE